MSGGQWRARCTYIIEHCVIIIIYFWRTGVDAGPCADRGKKTRCKGRRVVVLDPNIIRCTVKIIRPPLPRTRAYGNIGPGLQQACSRVPPRRAAVSVSMFYFFSISVSLGLIAETAFRLRLTYRVVSAELPTDASVTLTPLAAASVASSPSARRLALSRHRRPRPYGSVVAYAVPSSQSERLCRRVRTHDSSRAGCRCRIFFSRSYINLWFVVRTLLFSSRFLRPCRLLFCFRNDFPFLPSVPPSTLRNI